GDVVARRPLRGGLLRLTAAAGPGRVTHRAVRHPAGASADRHESRAATRKHTAPTSVPASSHHALTYSPVLARRDVRADGGRAERDRPEQVEPGPVPRARVGVPQVAAVTRGDD